MKGFIRLIAATLAVAVLSISCSKDKPTGSLSFDQSAVYLEASQTVTVHFTPSANIDKGSYRFTSKIEGWEDPIIDAQECTVTITAPSSFDGAEKTTAKTGAFVLSATPSGGTSVTAKLFVGVVSREDMSAKPANCYLVNKPLTNYTFDAMHNGAGTSALATASVRVIWQSASGLLQYVQLDGGKASFYIGADGKDKLTEGNALIGAYDAAGTLLWSWHIWVADFDPKAETLSFGGSSLMTRNLGALKNSNDSEADILASYGLYYQWGRKDPFIGPSTYDAATGKSATMYDGSGLRVTLKTVLSSKETGSQEYATENPLTYILTEKLNADWLFPSIASSFVPVRWANTKTENDPCPYGWRVATANVFSGVNILGSAVEGDVAKYGLKLSENASSGLFLGAGRRIYANGSVQNIYIPVSRADFAQPWVGLYWLADAVGQQSQALYFWFLKSDTTFGLDKNAVYGRANGMPVRCVSDVL